MLCQRADGRTIPLLLAAEIVASVATSSQVSAGKKRRGEKRQNAVRSLKLGKVCPGKFY